MSTDQLHFIQVAEKSWFVLSPDVKPMWLIVHGVVIHNATRETHIAYRIVTWNLDPQLRTIVAVVDMHADAIAWCQETYERAQRVKRERPVSTERFHDPATGLTIEELARLREYEARKLTSRGTR